MNHFQAIAAMADNRVIGCGSKIPWHLPEDFKWFKKMTTGQVIVMGRKTFESIGKALPHRETIVLSRRDLEIPGVRVVGSLAEIPIDKETRQVFICGGAEVYALALPLCSDLYLTHVKRTVAGDVFFPVFEDRFVSAGQIMETPDFEVIHYKNRAI